MVQRRQCRVEKNSLFFRGESHAHSPDGLARVYFLGFNCLTAPAAGHDFVFGFAMLTTTDQGGCMIHRNTLLTPLTTILMLALMDLPFDY